MIVPVSNLAEAATRLAKIGGHLMVEPINLDELDNDECYEVEFTLQSVVNSGEWEEKYLGEVAMRRIFGMKIDGTIEITFDKSDNHIEGEHFLIVKPALL